VHRDAETKNQSSQVKIGSAIIEKCSKLQCEDKQIPCVKVQYLVAMATWRPGVVDLVSNYICMYVCMFVTYACIM
jgi:hypothetical protein